MNIGLGISTRNRNDVFEHSYSQWLKHTPKGVKIVVVDDASEIPVENATFRFEENVGIAKAKNKCFQLLEDCDYIFLADDDVFPISDDWASHYINSGVNHAMLIWDKLHDGRSNGNRLISKQSNGVNVYANPCGCLLFYTKKCLETVGGMDEEYGIWGWEHVDLSRRIFNAGLTPHKYMDIDGSHSLFYAHDFYETVERSVSSKVRAEHIKRNQNYFNRNNTSIAYKPYKVQNNSIITTFLTASPDPQHGHTWQPDISLLQPLIDSLQGETLIILHDCFDGVVAPDNVKFVRVETLPMNPYVQRWYVIQKYLEQSNHDFVFCVDATDVKMLKSPFGHMNALQLYVGDEPSNLGNEWLLKHHDITLFKAFFKVHRQSQLLNAGLCGGKKEIVLSFLNKLTALFDEMAVGQTDMAAFNYVLYREFRNKIFHGRQVNTIFKSFKENSISWFMHK